MPVGIGSLRPGQRGYRSARRRRDVSSTSAYRQHATAEQDGEAGVIPRALFRRRAARPEAVRQAARADA